MVKIGVNAVKHAFQGDLRVIGFFVCTIAAPVIITPVIQVMAGCDEHGLGRGINAAGNCYRRIKGNRKLQIEFIPDSCSGISFITGDYDCKIYRFAILSNEAFEMSYIKP